MKGHTIPSESSSFSKFSVSIFDNQYTDKHYYCKQLTENIVQVYRKCNNDIKIINYKPQRILTVPSVSSSTNCYDNDEGNLIVKVHDQIDCYNTSLDISVPYNNLKIDHNSDILLSSYSIVDLLGVGTFGQVFRSERTKYLSNNKTSKDFVALKIIKNIPSYHSQGILECQIAKTLNDTYDPLNQRHIVRLLDSFMYRGHVCLVFELLGSSLLDLLTQNQYRGLPLSVVQRIARQIIIALVTMQDANVIHCDLKPENILLVPKGYNNKNNVSVSSSLPSKSRSNSEGIVSLLTQNLQDSSNNGASSVSDIKVIDLGSACFEGKTMYSYIQSRFYRAPEILLGIPYNGAIDLWSFGCVCVELYLGLPLFPGVSQHNQLTRIIEMFGQPSDHLIESGRNCNKYFYKLRSENRTASSSAYRLKTAEEYARDTKTEVPILKKYLRYNKFEEVIMKCPLPITSNKSIGGSNRLHWTSEQKQEELQKRQVFLDFLKGIFKLDPFQRWTAKQAASHPFITNSTPAIVPHIPLGDNKVEERRVAYAVATNQQNKKSPNSTNYRSTVATTNRFSSNSNMQSSIFHALKENPGMLSDPVNVINNVSTNLDVLSNRFDDKEMRPILKRGETIIPVRSPKLINKNEEIHSHSIIGENDHRSHVSYLSSTYTKESHLRNSIATLNPNHYNTMIPSHIYNNDVSHNTAYSFNQGSNYYGLGSGQSLQESNNHLMSDFGQALLRPYMNENRHLQSKNYYSNTSHQFSPNTYISPSNQSYSYGKSFQYQQHVPQQMNSSSYQNNAYSSNFHNQRFDDSPNSFTSNSYSYNSNNSHNSHNSHANSFLPQSYMIAQNMPNNMNHVGSYNGSSQQKLSQSYTHRDNLEVSPIASGKGFENIIANSQSFFQDNSMNISMDDNITNDISTSGAIADWDPFFSTDEDGVSTNESNRSNDSNIVQAMPNYMNYNYSNSYHSHSQWHTQNMQSYSLPNQQNQLRHNSNSNPNSYKQNIINGKEMNITPNKSKKEDDIYDYL